MPDVLALARRKYQAEGIDSLMEDFDELPLERIQKYIESVHTDIARRRAHLTVVGDDNAEDHA